MDSFFLKNITKNDITNVFNKKDNDIKNLETLRRLKEYINDSSYPWESVFNNAFGHTIDDDDRENLSHALNNFIDSKIKSIEPPKVVPANVDPGGSDLTIVTNHVLVEFLSELYKSKNLNLDIKTDEFSIKILERQKLTTNDELQKINELENLIKQQLGGIGYGTIMDGTTFEIKEIFNNIIKDIETIKNKSIVVDTPAKEVEVDPPAKEVVDTPATKVEDPPAATKVVDPRGGVELELKQKQFLADFTKFYMFVYSEDLTNFDIKQLTKIKSILNDNSEDIKIQFERIYKKFYPYSVRHNNPQYSPSVRENLLKVFNSYIDSKVAAKEADPTKEVVPPAAAVVGPTKVVDTPAVEVVAPTKEELELKEQHKVEVDKATRQFLYDKMFNFSSKNIENQTRVDKLAEWQKILILNGASTKKENDLFNEIVTNKDDDDTVYTTNISNYNNVTLDEINKNLQTIIDSINNNKVVGPNSALVRELAVEDLKVDSTIIDLIDLHKSEYDLRQKELALMAKREKELNRTIEKNNEYQVQALDYIEKLAKDTQNYQTDYNTIFKDIQGTDIKVAKKIKNNEDVIKNLLDESSKIQKIFEEAVKENEAQLQKINEKITSEAESRAKEYETIKNNNQKIDEITKKNEELEKDIATEVKIFSNTIEIKINDDYEDLSEKEKCQDYFKNNILQDNLYNFVESCNKLDSVPEWRALISTLIVGYLSEVLINPSTQKSVVVMPSYNYFNLVLVGTPGVGKSYTSEMIGKALKWSGFLTDGTLDSIKKPDIIGSYTGQTAPKVYLELTKALGKVAFIDEAYSIAGPKDETKGTFNEFGQEALDAITDYTSEHIGLFSIIAAGYQYEMENQFLNVNIGLKRRFPSVLTLNRYDLSSFWTILQNLLNDFSQKEQVKNHNRACFELLNLMFNYQKSPSPPIKLSKDWPNFWKGPKISAISFNIKIELEGETNFNIPILKLDNFQDKLATATSSGERILGENIDLVLLSGELSGVSTITKTFIKLFILQIFSETTALLYNGDLFRSQADNLTKFSQTILEDKILNPSTKFKIEEDNWPNGNIEWTQYLYFNLYFSKNPNQPVYNMSYTMPEFENSGGGKKTKYKNTIKYRNKYKYNKNTIKNKNKDKKSTRNRNKNKNKKHKSSVKNGNKYKVYGGAGESNEKEKEQCFKENYTVYLKNSSDGSDDSDISEKVQQKYIELKDQPEKLSSFIESLNEKNKTDKDKITKCFDRVFDKYLEDKKDVTITKPNIEDKSLDDVKEIIKDLSESAKNNAKPKSAKNQPPSEDEIQNNNNLKLYQEKEGELTFTLTTKFSNINFKAISTVLKTYEISEDKIKKYNDLYDYIYKNKKPVEEKYFVSLMNAYILLSTYIEAKIQHDKTKYGGKLDTDSWWFFNYNDFEDISNELNPDKIFDIIINVPGVVGELIENVLNTGDNNVTSETPGDNPEYNDLLKKINTLLDKLNNHPETNKHYISAGIEIKEYLEKNLNNLTTNTDAVAKINNFIYESNIQIKSISEADI